MITSKQPLRAILRGGQEFGPYDITPEIRRKCPFGWGLGVSGATVIDSVGMGRIIATIPIFAGFRDLMVGNRPSNKTILAAVDSSMVPELTEGIEKILGSMSEPGTGLILTLPINTLKGMGKGF